MEIYLVRHGETSGNVARRHQADTTPLSARGREQAEHAGKIVKDYKPTHIITSTIVRSVETASIIGQLCNIVPDTQSAFIELNRPMSLHGYHHRSLRSLWFYFLWYFGLTKDGESYAALRTRFKEAKSVLAEYPADARVVVVTHSVFITLFVAHLCQDEKLSLFQAARSFLKILTMRNTHIEMVMFDPVTKEGTCGWIVEKDA